MQWGIFIASCQACKKFSLEEIQLRVDEKFGEGLITVVPNQIYLGIRKKLKFIDRDYGEWETAPFNLLQNGNTHPLRGAERRSQTNLKKYGHENAAKNATCKQKAKDTFMQNHGVDNPMLLPEIKEKIRKHNQEVHGCDYPFVEKPESIEKRKNTNLSRYGAENPAHSVELQEKKKNTNLEIYGCVSPLQNEEVKTKIRATNLENLGVEYPTQSAEVREKIKTTFRNNYGCDHHYKTPASKEKQRQTNLKKYGVNSPKQINCPRLPNGLLLSEYLKLHNCKLWPTSCMNVWKARGFEVLQSYVEYGKEFGNDTSLEASFASTYALTPFKKRL